MHCAIVTIFWVKKNYCNNHTLHVFFHTNNCKPTFAHHCIFFLMRVNTDKHPTVSLYPERQYTRVGTLIVATFDVEYIYGFVWWGVCKQSRWRHSVTEPSEDSGYVLLCQRYDNNKMVAMRYYGNVMTTTMSQYSDDVSSVTHAGCICAPVNAITTCIYFTHRSDHTKTSVRR